MEIDFSNMDIKNILNGQKVRAKVYAITSGKGGVGKTSIAVNLSITLSRMGMKVLLIDADMGLANVDIMTGVNIKHSLEDVLSGNISIFDAVVDGPEDITILPSASGLGRISELEDNGEYLRNEILRLQNAFDIIIIDTGAGISANVIDFVFMAQEVIVIMTPEPTAFADAYAMVKIVSLERPETEVGIIINMAPRDDEARRIGEKFNEIVQRFLRKNIIYRGAVLRDKAVGQAVLRQIPLALYAEKSPAMFSIKNIAKGIIGTKIANKNAY